MRFFTLLFLASMASATPNSDRLGIVHEFLYPGVDGIAMTYDPLTDVALFVQWPQGLRQPSMGEIDGYRADYLKWRAIEAKRRDVIEARKRVADLEPLGTLNPRYQAAQARATALVNQLGALPRNSHEPGDPVPGP